MNQVEHLRWALTDANAELARHHVSFAAISTLLDDFFSDDPARYLSPVETLKAIRNIVG